MGVGVVAYGVTLGQNLGVEVGVELYILAQDEECRLGVVAPERRQNPLGNLGRRAIVESEIDTTLVLDVPNEFGNQPAYKLWRRDLHPKHINLSAKIQI